MAEKRKVVDGEKILFEGLFDMKGVIGAIHKWFADHDYKRQDMVNEELVEEGHKQINLKLEPFRKWSDYEKTKWELDIWFKNMTDVEVEQNGVKLKLKKGKVSIEVDGWVITDYEGSWETKPMFYFFRTMVDKFIRKDQLSSIMKLTQKDARRFQYELKSYLNMFRYQ